MKIVIPGGSGLIGTLLANSFCESGDEVVVLSRRPRSEKWKSVEWDGKTLSDWKHEIDGADVVINLAGRSVNCRYNKRNRHVIMNSRVDSTRVIGEAIQQAQSPTKVWLQSSTATIYSHRYDAANDEATGILGGEEINVPETWRFSIDVAKNWEQTANEVEVPDTRKVFMRTAVVMHPGPNSAFNILHGMIRRGLGGKNGHGRQYVSWIHGHDFVQAVRFLIDHPLEGPVNIAAPHPLPNQEFMQHFREAVGVKLGLPATKWMLELAAIFLRTETELILKSRRVVPGKLQNAGFQFQYPEWKIAVRNLVQHVG